MIPETSRTTVILTYLSIGFLIFLVIFGLACGMKLLKENVFFPKRNFGEMKITPIKEKTFLVEVYRDSGKEFRIYNSHDKSIQDITKGNRYIEAMYVNMDSIILREEKLGETKIRVIKENQKAISIDSYLFTTEIERKNNEIYRFCKWSDIKSQSDKIAFFICSEKQSKLLIISLDHSFKRSSVLSSISDNVEKYRSLEWIDQERIIFSGIQAGNDDIALIEYDLRLKEAQVIYGSESE